MSFCFAAAWIGFRGRGGHNRGGGERGGGGGEREDERGRWDKLVFVAIYVDYNSIICVVFFAPLFFFSGREEGLCYMGCPSSVVTKPQEGVQPYMTPVGSSIIIAT